MLENLKWTRKKSTNFVFYTKKTKASTKNSQMHMFAYEKKCMHINFLNSSEHIQIYECLLKHKYMTVNLERKLANIN